MHGCRCCGSQLRRPRLTPQVLGPHIQNRLHGVRRQGALHQGACGGGSSDSGLAARCHTVTTADAVCDRLPFVRSARTILAAQRWTQQPAGVSNALM